VKTKLKLPQVRPCSSPAASRTPFGIPVPVVFKYLLIMTPNVFSLIEGIHALKDRTPASLQQLFREHDSELL